MLDAFCRFSLTMVSLFAETAVVLNNTGSMWWVSVITHRNASRERLWYRTHFKAELMTVCCRRRVTLPKLLCCDRHGRYLKPCSLFAAVKHADDLNWTVWKQWFPHACFDAAFHLNGELLVIGASTSLMGHNPKSISHCTLWGHANVTW